MGTADAGGRHQPYYHVLVDHRDRPFQSTYVAQENIVRPNASGSSSTGVSFESEVRAVYHSIQGGVFDDDSLATVENGFASRHIYRWFDAAW